MIPLLPTLEVLKLRSHGMECTALGTDIEHVIDDGRPVSRPPTPDPLPTSFATGATAAAVTAAATTADDSPGLLRAATLPAGVALCHASVPAGVALVVPRPLPLPRPLPRPLSRPLPRPALTPAPAAGGGRTSAEAAASAAAAAAVRVMLETASGVPETLYTSLSALVRVCWAQVGPGRVTGYPYRYCHLQYRYCHLVVILRIDTVMFSILSS